MIYYAHAVDLAFAVTVWKCQKGTFDYIIALLEHSPGSPTLTFEKYEQPKEWELIPEYRLNMCV